MPKELFICSMNKIGQVLSNSSLKPKEKIQQIRFLLENDDLKVEEFVNELKLLSPKQRVYGLEVLENYSREHKEFNSALAWEFAVSQLNEPSPAILREAGRVVANLAPHHFSDATNAIKGLLLMSEHAGTIVRWSAAQGLTGIYIADKKQAWDLRPTLESIAKREEKESIRKIYGRALLKSNSN